MLAFLRSVQKAHIGDQILFILFSLDLRKIIRCIFFLALMELALGRLVIELVIMHLLDTPVLVQVLFRSLLLLIYISHIVLLDMLTFV